MPDDPSNPEMVADLRVKLDRLYQLALFVGLELQGFLVDDDRERLEYVLERVRGVVAKVGQLDPPLGPADQAARDRMS